MTRIRRRSPCAIAALMLSAVVFTGCGESAQEKAKAQVCSARSDISKQIKELEGLSLSTNIVTEAKDHFEAIRADLAKIKDAQPNLEPARKEQVETATKTFGEQLNTIASGLVASLGSGNLATQLANAEPKLQSALSQLASDSKQALGPISCS